MKIINFISSLLLVLGVELLLFPLVSIWFSGDYSRYAWLISGPYPFSQLGSGPFQLRIIIILLILSFSFITSSFILRKNKNVNKESLGVVTIILAGSMLLSTILFPQKAPISSIDSFESCVKAGYPILEIYPGQCIAPDGRSFTENIILPTEPSSPEDSDNTVCTMEAKLCPDGSYVGRVSSSCQFLPCPERN